MQRRELFKKLASGVIGLGLVLVPLGAGIVFLLDPLRRGSQKRGFKRVASAEGLPLGVPRSFTVSGTRSDAWETAEEVPIGAVYLIRQPQEIQAFQVTCPHAGCFVDYDPANQSQGSQSCNLCYRLEHPDVPAPGNVLAPDLTGYATREWVRGMIMDSSQPGYYGSQGHSMPKFAERLTPQEVGLLADWILGKEGPTEGLRASCNNGKSEKMSDDFSNWN